MLSIEGGLQKSTKVATEKLIQLWKIIQIAGFDH